MADSIYKQWEKELQQVKSDYNKALNDIEALKKALYNLNYNAAANVSGRVIHDDHRLILSAPEIIIGNVNLAGILNPDGDSTIVIRGTKVSVEGAGDAGKVSTRAAVIEQTAENPGIDGTEHRVGNMSSVITQACSVTIDSSSTAAGGAFLDPIVAERGSVNISADAKVGISALKAKDSLLSRITQRENAVNTAFDTAKSDFENGLGQFSQKRSQIEKLLDERAKLDTEETAALRTDYFDLDELNLQIDEKAVDIAGEFYTRLSNANKMIELERQKKYFAQFKQDTENLQDFSTSPTGTGIALSSESIQLSAVDGDNNLRTNKEAEVKIVSNAVKVEGVFDDKGSPGQSSVFAVNTRKVELSTAGRKDVQNDEDGSLKNATLPAEGDVIITSKNVTVQSVDAQMSNKEYKGEKLTENGNIVLRAENIGLSSLDATDVKYNDDGQVTESTNKPKGQVFILSKQVSVSSMGMKTKDGKTEETGFEDGSTFMVRTKDVSFSAADHQGKNAGSFSVNAKDLQIASINVDPKSQDFKEYTEGGKLSVYSQDLQFVASKSFSASSDEDMQFSSKKNLVLNGKESTVTMQDDKNYLQLKGGNTEMSGSKVNMKGDVNANALSVKVQTVDQIKITGAVESKNFSDSIFIGSKDTGTGSSGAQLDQDKTKISDNAGDKGAVTDPDTSKIANQERKLSEVLKDEGAEEKEKGE